MYEAYYHLSEEPFRLSADHRFCFAHQSFARARAYMQYAFERAEGFVMVTGQPGTGKTTLVNELIHTLQGDQRVKVATLVTTQLEADDLLRMVTYAFGLSDATVGNSTENTENKAQLLQRLYRMLVSNHQQGGRALLMIDEAQGLNPAALEELRLLTNLQRENTPLVQIFLLGQEGLHELIQSPDMEQVHQRIVASCRLKPLALEETRAYILHRLETAGWQGQPLLSEALYPIIHKYSQGVARRINQICSRLFLHGAIEELSRLGVNDAQVVIDELRQEQLLPSTLAVGAEFQAHDRYQPWQASEAAVDAVDAVDAVEPVKAVEAVESFTAARVPELQALTPATPTVLQPIGPDRLTATPDYPDEHSPVPTSNPVEAGRAGRAGLVIFSLSAIVLLVVLIVFLINPGGFIRQVQLGKHWIEQQFNPPIPTPPHPAGQGE